MSPEKCLHWEATPDYLDIQEKSSKSPDIRRRIKRLICKIFFGNKNNKISEENFDSKYLKKIFFFLI